MRPIYKDLGDEPEDERIRQIGEAVMQDRKIVSFIVDDEPGKAERYIRKLKKKFPNITILGRGKGPVPKTEWVKVGPQPN